METLVAVVSSITLFQALVVAVPPEACFAKFRWDDCGRPPRPVMYYWKPGSRCEIGLWRGCLPNINMFKDEYECVATCIFTVRAKAEDFHNQAQVDYQYIYNDETTTDVTGTDGNTTISDDGNSTITGDSTGDVTTDGSGEAPTDEATHEGEDGGDGATTAAEGDETEAPAE